MRDSLQFKRDMLNQAIKQGVVSRTLKIINSILGSLSKVFPSLCTHPFDPERKEEPSWRQ